ncbi:MAG: CvpA family protein [Candidatus Omnitrophota bacterium]
MLGGIFSNINWVDVVAVVILLRAVHIGSNVGLSTEIYKFAGIVTGLVFAIFDHKTAASLINTYTLISPSAVLDAVAFLAIVTLFVFAFRIARALFTTLVQFQFAALLEKYGGLLLGLVRGAVSVSVVLIFLLMLPSEYLKTSIETSVSGRYFLKIGTRIYASASKVWPRLDQDIEIFK